MAKREKGTATLACPTCGTELAATEQPDGSYAASACTKCSKATTTEKASQSTTGSRREAGTDVTEGDS